MTFLTDKIWDPAQKSPNEKGISVQEEQRVLPAPIRDAFPQV